MMHPQAAVPRSQARGARARRAGAGRRARAARARRGGVPDPDLLDDLHVAEIERPRVRPSNSVDPEPSALEQLSHGVHDRWLHPLLPQQRARHRERDAHQRDALGPRGLRAREVPLPRPPVRARADARDADAAARGDHGAALPDRGAAAVAEQLPGHDRSRRGERVRRPDDAAVLPVAPGRSDRGGPDRRRGAPPDVSPHRRAACVAGDPHGGRPDLPVDLGRLHLAVPDHQRHLEGDRPARGAAVPVRGDVELSGVDGGLA